MVAENERGKEGRINHILVLGGGSAGLMTAHILKRQLPELKITVVRSETLPPIGVGESTTPLVAKFVEKYAQFDQGEFFRKVRPTWKLGIRFDWVPKGEDAFYYPFDMKVFNELPDLREPIGFHYYTDARVETPFTRMMDRKQAPVLPRPDGGFHTQRGVAYHLENRPFGRFLEEQAVARGIELLDRKIVSTERSNDGNVEYLIDEDGEKLPADFFVDATGFGSQLLGGELEEPFVSYDRSLFCDRAVTGTWERRSGILPYTSADTMEHGWCWRVELLDRVNRGYVYSSQFCDDEKAVAELRMRNPEITDQDLRVLKFSPGRRRRCWVNNVFAVGNAAGFMEPLEATGLHMICLGARLLAQGLQFSVFRPTETLRRLANESLGEIWDDIRDCLALHYKFNRREETPFWNTCRQETDLGNAERFVEYYRENGAAPFGAHLISRHSIFGSEGYYAMMIGLKVPSIFDFRRERVEEKKWETAKKAALAMTQEALKNDRALELVYGDGSKSNI